MVNLVIPIAGVGQRFINAGYNLPKQLITIGDRTHMEWSMRCIERTIETRTIFIMRRDQQLNHSLDVILKEKFGENCVIVTVPGVTGGAVDTVLRAEELINNDEPLIIYTPDVYFEPHLQVSKDLFEDCDGHILTFKANSTNYSYVELDNSGYASRTEEKKIISPFAAVGVYMYSKGQDFVQVAKELMAANDRTNNEFYLCPTYNYLIRKGKKIKTTLIDKMHIFGTPEEMDFFTTCSLKTFPENKWRVALCADHSGYEMKEEAKEVLISAGISYVDFGTFSPRDCDYTTFVAEACKAVLDNTCSFGLGFCRTGQGVNITANKIAGIRSALVFDKYTATFAIRHNCANFFSVSSKYTKDVSIVIDAWWRNTFDGGRHQNRIQELE
jgi:RpiB/LacA/LacB family sugar-phosphate isomerase